MDSTLSSARELPVRAYPGTRKMVLGGSLLAVACVLGLLEAAFASPVPGVRLGLANIAVMVALVVLGPSRALAVSLLRVLIVGLATGAVLGPVSALALGGAVASWAAMSVAYRSQFDFTLVGVSVAGATAHVGAQFCIAAVMAGAPGILAAAPAAIIASLLFGIATGFAARLVISRMEGTVLSGG